MVGTRKSTRRTKTKTSRGRSKGRVGRLSQVARRSGSQSRSRSRSRSESGSRSKSRTRKTLGLRRGRRRTTSHLIGTRTVSGEIHVPYWSGKDNRMYEAIKSSYLERGERDGRASAIAAATVNRQRRVEGRLVSQRSSSRTKKSRRSSRLK